MNDQELLYTDTDSFIYVGQLVGRGRDSVLGSPLNGNTNESAVEVWRHTTLLVRPMPLPESADDTQLKR